MKVSNERNFDFISLHRIVIITHAAHVLLLVSLVKKKRLQFNNRHRRIKLSGVL